MIRRRISDPEQLSEAMRGADLSPCQLTRERGVSELVRISLPGACLDLAKIRPAILFTGASPRDCYTIVFVLACPEPGYSFNFSTGHTDGYIGFFPPGGEVDARTPENYANAILTVPSGRFIDALSFHFPEIPEHVLASGAGMRVARQDQESLRELVDAISQLPSGPGSTYASELALRHLEEELLTSFFVALRSGASDLVGSSSGIVGGRQRRFRQVQDYIAAHRSEPIKVGEICAAVGLSVRGVENLFNDFLGTSPHIYLRHHRLHAARRELLQQASAGSGSVKQVALNCGFWHLGRFSAYYRKLFGEKPGDTLAKR